MLKDFAPPEFELISDEEKKQQQQLEEKQQQLDEKRQRLLDSVRAFEHDTAEQKVAWLLNNYPETRNSDITLQIKYWEHFNRDRVSGGSIALVDLYSLPRYGSISRHRSRIQNQYGLFLAVDVVRKKRGKLSGEEKEHAIEKNEVSTDCSLIFADESGKNDKYLIVGSAWVATPLSALLLSDMIATFRETRMKGRELHFTKAGKRDRELYYSFMDMIVSNMDFLGFKALYLSNQGIRNKQDMLVKLFFHLVAKGFDHEVESKRVRLPRGIEFTKDKEEEGYDSMLLAEMRTRLMGYSTSKYKGGLRCADFGALDSKDSNLLQLADVYTGCLHRVLNGNGSTHWKDVFAKDFLEAVGTSIESFGDSHAGDTSIAMKL